MFPTNIKINKSRIHFKKQIDNQYKLSNLNKTESFNNTDIININFNHDSKVSEKIKFSNIFLFDFFFRSLMKI